MSGSDWITLIVSIASSIVIMLPLVVSLVKHVKLLAKEKNWAGFLVLLNTYIMRAEENFDTGADKEDWVVSMIMASADVIQFDIDEEALREIIRNIIEVTNNVNVLNIIQEQPEQIEEATDEVEIETEE